MDHNAYRTRLQSCLERSEAFFSAEEFAQRRQRVSEAMARRGLDALVLTNPAEINYLTGYTTFEVSVHTALVFRPERCLLQVPSIEMGPAVTTAHVDEIIGYRWEAIQNVIDPMVAALSSCSRIGFDPWSGSLRPGVLDAMRQQLGSERFEEAASLMADVRLVKTDAELQCLRESARMTQSGLEAGIKAVKPGASENDVAAAGSRALLSAGSEFMSLQPIVVSGPRSSVIHLNHQNRKIEPGDSVFLEFGAVSRRYTAPMMRTAVAGEPSDDMKRMRDSCRAIHDALLGAMKPGNHFDDAARAAEQALAPVADEVFFSGVFGYAVGATFPPSWVEGTGFIARGEQRRFEAGMVFHLPLCLRIPGQWGMGMSNTVVVGNQGSAPLTHNDWQLPVCH